MQNMSFYRVRILVTSRIRRDCGVDKAYIGEVAVN